MSSKEQEYFDKLALLEESLNIMTNQIDDIANQTALGAMCCYPNSYKNPELMKQHAHCTAQIDKIIDSMQKLHREFTKTE